MAVIFAVGRTESFSCWLDSEVTRPTTLDLVDALRMASKASRAFVVSVVGGAGRYFGCGTRAFVVYLAYWRRQSGGGRDNGHNQCKSWNSQPKEIQRMRTTISTATMTPFLAKLLGLLSVSVPLADIG